MQQVELIQKHIDFLKSLDTDEFYDKEEDEVRTYASITLQELIHMGHHATPALVQLLNTEFTWSCFFALTILRQTKDPHAVPALIAFLKKEPDDSMANEEAMFALQDIGDPSIQPLIEELEEAFDNKKYNSYLVGSLTGIIGPDSYDFMTKIIKDYIEKPWRYKGWFLVDDFAYNFVVQERIDAVPLLQKILEMNTINGEEKQELEETIKALQDPESYKKEIQETINEMKAL